MEIISVGRSYCIPKVEITWVQDPGFSFAWSNHWLHHNARSLLPTSPQTIDLSLKLDVGRLSLSLEILDYDTFAPRLCSWKWNTFCVGDNKTYKHIWDKFPLLFENVVFGSLKYFFWLNHQDDICLYLTKDTSLCHLVGLKPSWHTHTLPVAFNFSYF